MTPRERAAPSERADFPRSLGLPHRSFRIIVDISALVSIAGLLVGGGMTYQKFLDDGKRLDQYEQLLQQVIGVEQQQQTTLAALSQNVADIKDALDHQHGG